MYEVALTLEETVHGIRQIAAIWLIHSPFATLAIPPTSTRRVESSMKKSTVISSHLSEGGLGHVSEIFDGDRRTVRAVALPRPGLLQRSCVLLWRMAWRVRSKNQNPQLPQDPAKH